MYYVDLLIFVVTHPDANAERQIIIIKVKYHSNFPVHVDYLSCEYPINSTNSYREKMS